MARNSYDTITKKKIVDYTYNTHKKLRIFNILNFLCVVYSGRVFVHKTDSR